MGTTSSASVGDETILAEIVRRLVGWCHPDRIYLFGSAARGEAGPDSDLDIMVVVPDDTPASRRNAGDAYSALCGLGVPKDVQVWTRSTFESQLHLKASLPATIVREGKLLYAAEAVLSRLPVRFRD